MAVRFHKIAAKLNTSTHHAEKVRGDLSEADLFRSAIFPGQNVAARPDGAEFPKAALRLVTQIEEFGIGKGKVLHIAFSHVAACQHEPIRILVGEWPQQHSVGHAEYRCGGADAERQCNHRRDGKHGIVS